MLEDGESEKHWQECKRQLGLIGFDVVEWEKERRKGKQNSLETGCLVQVPQYVLNAFSFVESLITKIEDITTSEKYELTEEENELFNTLPEWHRDVFINYPGEWTVTPVLFPNTEDRKGKNKHINQWLIKNSMAAILTNDEISNYRWERSKDIKSIELISDKMEAWEVSLMAYPLHSYEAIAEHVENKIINFFQEESISIKELGDGLEKDYTLGDAVFLAWFCWKHYLDDKKEYIQLYNNSILSTITQNQIKEETPQPLETTLNNADWTKSFFKDVSGEYAEILKAADTAFRKKFEKQHSPWSLFINMPELCPDTVAGVVDDKGKGNTNDMRVMFKGGGYLFWKNYLTRISHTVAVNQAQVSS